MRPAAVALLLLFGARAAAAPLDAALRLVPNDASLCVAVQNLRDHAKNLRNSSFVKELRGQPAADRLREQPDFARLAAVASWGLEMLGTSADELTNDVLGDAVLFAYLPARAEPARPEAGVLIVAPRKPEALLRLVGRLNELQQRGGELKAVEESTHGGHRLTVRQKAGGGSEAYAVAGGVFVFSGELWAVQAALDRGELSEPTAAADGFARLGLGGALAAAWLNPRAMDAEVAGALATADAKSQAFQRTFAELWRGLDGVGVGLHLGDDVRLELALATAADRLPVAVQPWLAPAGPPPTPPLRGPADAFVAASGRLDVPATLDLLTAVMPPAEAVELRVAIDRTLGPVVGRDRLPAVLAGLGPTWAAWLMPPTDAAHVWPAGALALEIPNDDVARTVMQAVDLGAQLLRVKYNQDHADQIDWREESAGGATLRVLRNPEGFAAGLAPCYVRRSGCLVLATSPEAMARLEPAAGGEAVPVLEISGEPWRKYADADAGRLAGPLAAVSGREPEAVRRLIERVESVAGTVESVTLGQRSGAGRWAVEVRVKTRAALK